MIKRLFVPPAQGARASAGLLVLRLFCGYAMMLHGWGKIQNPFGWMGPNSGTPGIFQALAALSEFGGGIAWMLGLLTPLASFGMACTMLVAAHMHRVVLGQSLVAKDANGSAEPAVVYLCVAVLLLLAGPGRYSLDRHLFREKT